MNFRRLALVAHDACKGALLEWARSHRGLLERLQLSGTGTTGGLIARELGLPVKTYLSGPKGGDLQIGAAIAEQEIDGLVFFWDPLTAQPHDPDIKALLRVAVLWNIPFACNERSATLLLSALAAGEDLVAGEPVAD